MMCPYGLTVCETRREQGRVDLIGLDSLREVIDIQRDSNKKRRSSTAVTFTIDSSYMSILRITRRCWS